MTAVAIYSADPVLRCSLERLLREDPAMTVVGVADKTVSYTPTDRAKSRRRRTSRLAAARAVGRLANPAQRNSLRGSC